jgi:Transglycosylase
MFPKSNHVLHGSARPGGVFTHTTQNADWVKNLFFGTGRSVLRKGAEFAPVPVAEFLLGKRRILEIYLNVVEMGSDNTTWYKSDTTARKPDELSLTRVAVRAADLL